MRAIFGPKPVSYPSGASRSIRPTETAIKKVLPWGIYPGVYEASRRPRSTRTARCLSAVHAHPGPVGRRPLAAGHGRQVERHAQQIVERFGPNRSGDYFFVVRNADPNNAHTDSVTLYNSDLGWTSNPTLTITSLLGADAHPHATTGTGMRC